MVLICCDLTRKTDAIGGWSGAHMLTRKGVPAVVAMQGDVQPEFAMLFMEYLLGNLLIHQPVSEAVSISRDFAARKAHARLQAFLPAIFSNNKSSAEPIIRSLREYRDKVSLLSARIPNSARYMMRPQLEEQIRKALDENGLRMISGGPGCGKSASLARVVSRRVNNEKVAPARPIFYISCDQPGVACKTPLQLFGQISRLMEESRKLLSDQKIRLRPDALDSFFVQLSRKKVIVIVDNFNFPSNPQDVEAWTNSLTQAAAVLTESLFIFVTNSVPPALVRVPVVRVESFSSPEISKYLTKFVPSCFPLAGRIEKELGGSPLFLDALRSRVEDNAGKCDVSFLQGLSSSNVPESYLKSVQSILGLNERRAFYNLCRLPAPITIRLALEFLDSSKDGSSLPSLLRIGLLRKTIRNKEEYCYVPAALTLAAKRLTPQRIAKAAGVITARFEAKMPRDDSTMKNFVKSIAEQSSGMTLLKCIQNAYFAHNHLPHAKDVAELAEQANMEHADLWRLYKGLLRYFSGAQELPLRLRAAELAQELGRAKECCDVLTKIPKGQLTPFYHVKFLKVLAALWKDTKQHAGVPETLKLYEESVPMAKDGLAGRLSDADAGPEDWKKMLAALLHNRLTVRAFLERAPAGAIMADLAELKELLGDSPEFANELCLVAEYELKAPPELTDWDGVAGRLLEAKRLLLDHGHDRYLAQCLYFYGEYLRRRFDPKLQDAAHIYHEAEERASKVGDYRLIGRARRRWVDLEWRTLKTMSAANATEALDKAISPLATRWEEALSMRVLERLYTLRAEIGKELPADPTKDFLMLACQAADQPVLQARSDNTRYGQALRRYFGELKKASNFAEAHQFLHDNQNAVRNRLELDPGVNDPWSFYAILQEKYPDEKER